MNIEKKIEVASEIVSIFGQREILVEWDQDENYEGWLDILCNLVDCEDIKQLQKLSPNFYVGTIMINNDCRKIDIRCHYNEN